MENGTPLGEIEIKLDPSATTNEMDNRFIQLLDIRCGVEVIYNGWKVEGITCAITNEPASIEFQDPFESIDPLDAPNEIVFTHLRWKEISLRISSHRKVKMAIMGEEVRNIFDVLYEDF